MNAATPRIQHVSARSTHSDRRRPDETAITTAQPKVKINQVIRLRSTLKALVDNYFQGPPLALPLEQLLAVLFERLHEKTTSIEVFDSQEESDGECSDVAMDVEEDFCTHVEDC